MNGKNIYGFTSPEEQKQVLARLRAAAWMNQADSQGLEYSVSAIWCLSNNSFIRTSSASFSARASSFWMRSSHLPDSDGQDSVLFHAGNL